MRIAVIGASGFIGRHVVAELARHDVDIVAVSRHPHIWNLPQVQHVPLDISQEPASAYERLGRPDAVIHLAWGGLPNYRSLHHFEHELPVHYSFLKHMIEAGLARLTVTGTCFEYGMQSGALSEYMPAFPDNAYGYAKDALRRQLQYLQAVLPFELIWPRLFYLYGDGQAESSLYPLLSRAVQRGEQSFAMSGGEQLRDYLPVAAVARKIVALTLLRRDVGVVNVCSGQPISIRRLVESWILDNDWKIDLDLGRYPYPDYEPHAFWGDNAKLNALIGDTP